MNAFARKMLVFRFQSEQVNTRYAGRVKMLCSAFADKNVSTMVRLQTVLLLSAQFPQFLPMLELNSTLFVCC